MIRDRARISADERGNEDESEFVVSDRELLSIVRRELDSTIGWTRSDLHESLRASMNRYLGGPRGDEREGRSTVLSREVLEQVEWALPDLMEIFDSSDTVCRFLPVEPEDRPGSEQATDVANYIYRRCNGPNVIYTATKDALIQKLGVVKVTHQKSDEGQIEFYEGKTIADVMLLEQDPEVDIRRATPRALDPNGALVSLPPELYDEMDPERLRYDLEVVRVPRMGEFKLDNVAPENFLVNRDCRALDHHSCKFIGDWIESTASQLIAWGVPKDLVQRIPTAHHAHPGDQDYIVRSQRDDAQPFFNADRKDAERPLFVADLYVKADRDGDGISEWWNVMVGGEYGEVLIYASPCDGHPYAAGTPVPVPHRLYGLSLDDMVVDLEDTNTVLRRQTLDSVYLTNDPRNIVYSLGNRDESTPQVNIEQLNASGPGTWIEEYTQGALRPYEQRTNLAELTSLVEFQRAEVQNRTGIGREAQGVAPEAISKHVYGAMVQASAAQKRIVLIARLLGDSLLRGIFKLIYKLVLQNYSEPMLLRLRNEFVQVDPSSWSTSYDCQLAIGFGHGSRMERVQNRMTIVEIQKQFVAEGLTNIVNMEQLYNSAAGIAEDLGFKDTSEFFSKPDENNPPPEPEPSPEEKALAMQQQVETLRLENDRQKVEVDRWRALLDAKKVELEHEREMKKLELDHQIKLQKDDPSFELGAKTQ